MSALERELQMRLSQLGPDEKRRVLEFTRALGTRRPRGTPGSALLPLFGSITDEDAREMLQAIEEGCERIDPDGW
jgi:hypothetical protein